jgi:hypothetical protein
MIFRAAMAPFHEVTALHDGRIVRLWRSPRAFGDAAELRFERRRLVEELNAVGRDGRGLLIDSRLAPHSTEAQLEEEFARYRREVMAGYVRVASLVRTKVAILQVNRLLAGQGPAFQAFDDEAEAIEYLLNGPPPSRRPSRAPL